MISSTGQTLIEQKRLQWAREREEMMGLCGLWGQAPMRMSESRRGSMLPPIQSKLEDAKAEESETSGYTSDSPLHDVVSTKAQKDVKNEWRARSYPGPGDWGGVTTPETPEDRLKWGDRGVGVGHLWEPVPELPDARLPQVLESYRTTPRWVERGLGMADGSKAEILEIHHQDDVPSQTKYILGQNIPLPPDVLEERERKRIKAMQHQEAIRKQLEERERKRREEKENRLKEERIEEERIWKEREIERKRKDEEKEKEKIKRKKDLLDDQKMREALKAAEQRASEEKSHQKRRELNRVNEKAKSAVACVRDSWCQSETCPGPDTQDASSQCDSGFALVLDGGPGLALLMSPPRVVVHASTQTRVTSTTHTYSSRSEISERQCDGRRSHSQPRRCIRDRPKWGINRPTVQYLKQSEKDPHYLRRLRRRARRAPSHPENELPLHSEHKHLPVNTDDECGLLQPPVIEVNNILDNGFRMDSGQSSPRFVPIKMKQDDKLDEPCQPEERRSGLSSPLIELKYSGDKDGKESSNDVIDQWMDVDKLVMMNNADDDVDADVSDVDNTSSKSSKSKQGENSERSCTSSPGYQQDDDDVVVQTNLLNRISALHVGLQRLNDLSPNKSTSSSLLSVRSTSQ